MAGEALSIDPVSEDAANAELALSTANGYYLLSHSYPPPQRDTLWVSSADTEGESVGNVRYKNREIPITLRATGSTQADIAVKVQALQEKIAKLVREGGTLKRTLPGGEVIVFDVLDAEADALFDNRFIHRYRTEIGFRLICKPFGRGAAVQQADHTETTLPCLTFTEIDLKGDVPGLGKLVVDDDSAADQRFLMWGVRSRYYDSGNALFYEAESLTPLGTAATAVGPTGASGAGSNTVLEGSLTPSFRAILSTQASGGGAHLTHVGRYQVWARVQTPTANTGAVQVGFEWAEGDFRKVTRNDPVNLYPDSTDLGVWEGTWRLVNLGQIDIAKVAQGAQRWEGRVLAKSTIPGDDIYVDCLMFVPVDGGYGEVRAGTALPAPTSFSARDEFDQSAGALAGKTLPVGGTWAGAGDADDFAVETTGKTAQRATTSDSPARYGLAGATTYSSIAVQTDVKFSAQVSCAGGVIARYVDVSNVFIALLNPTTQPSLSQVAVAVAVGGVVTNLVVEQVPVLVGEFNTIGAAVDSGGRWSVWLDSPGRREWSGQNAALATGGALASGQVGLWDYNSTPNACTRNYDNFSAWVPTFDAAVFASQSLEIRHDRVIREDSAGAIWTPVSDYKGSYFLVPPAGREDRTLQVLVKGSRNEPNVGADSAIDDISARLTYVPRFLQVPEP